MNLQRRFSVAFLAAIGLAGCATAPATSGINDPYETTNRQIHSFNVGLDKMLLRPASGAYDAVLPPPAQQGVANFAHNLGTPSDIVNDLLQGRLDYAAQHTLRFALNTTFGLGGIFDVATEAGMPDEDTDFGETLHVWGVGEGAYVELPALGPSTERDAVGEVVDLVTDPVGMILKPPASYTSTAASIGSKLTDRSRFKDTLDSVLYDSADGYAQLRLLYLQKRRHDLGQTQEETDDTFIDPYEDPYGE